MKTPLALNNKKRCKIINYDDIIADCQTVYGGT